MFAIFQQGSDFSLGWSGGIPPQLRSRIKWGALIAGVVVGFVVLSYLRTLYTDWLWFTELGLRSVFLKVLVTRVLLFVAAGLIFVVFIGISLYFAYRVSQGPEQIPLPHATHEFLKQLIIWGAVAAAVVLGLVFGSIASSQWVVFLKFSEKVPFGIVEPIFHEDASFYVFTLALYEFVRSWVLGGALAILIGTLAMYFVNFSLRGVGFLLTPGVKVQVSIIVAVIMLVLGLGNWLDRWGLVLSSQGVVFGATYADINARKVALLVLTIVAFASVVLILINAYMRGVRLLVGAVVLWVVLAIVLGALWPNAIQRFRVNPQEFAREKQYIETNIQFTRFGYGLAEVKEQLYPVDPTLLSEATSATADLVKENLRTIDNIRLWDRVPLTSVYRFEQLIRPYYDFGEADVDRYLIDGQYRQVMLSAREVAPEKLDEASQTWVNMKLRYTHGFGVAMSPVTEFSSLGRPEFFAADIPPDGVISVESKTQVGPPATVISNPRIYFGENTLGFVIVNTNQLELDYYQAELNEVTDSQYDGLGGVPIGSLLARLAYAWQLGDLNVLISGEITGDSRILYRRQVQQRVSTVAPFLRLDEDPYIVAAEGGLFWIQDAYTFTERFPYSDPNAAFGFNYIRNSVKVTIDAYDGTMRFYVADPDDAMIKTYQGIFPELFIPIEDMPASLRAHVRYPLDLFGFQSGKYLRYHMSDPQDFYNLEDIWNIPNEKFGQSDELQRVEPYYIIMKIPGEEREEFVLLLPFTRNEPNPIMAGWLAARNDGESYGELVALIFPKERRVKGPEQIEADIDTNVEISQQFTLLCQTGSFCIRGNILVIPIASGDKFGLLYAEPIYLQAENVAFPALKKVILATDEKVVMEDSVPLALEELTGFSRTATTAPADGAPAPPEPATAPEPADALRTEIGGLSEAFEALKVNLRVLEEALNRLKELAGPTEE